MTITALRIRIIVHSRHAATTANKRPRQKSEYRFLPHFFQRRDGKAMHVNPSFILRDVLGKKILMPVTRNEITDTPIVLNDVASEIWVKAEGISDIVSLIRDIDNTYGLQAGSEEEKTVSQFIDQLLEMGLIHT